MGDIILPQQHQNLLIEDYLTWNPWPINFSKLQFAMFFYSNFENPWYWWMGFSLMIRSAPCLLWTRTSIVQFSFIMSSRNEDTSYCFFTSELSHTSYIHKWEAHERVSKGLSYRHYLEDHPSCLVLVEEKKDDKGSPQPFPNDMKNSNITHLVIEFH